jgi:hypothetical protein
MEVTDHQTSRRGIAGPGELRHVLAGADRAVLPVSSVRCVTDVLGPYGAHPDDSLPSLGGVTHQYESALMIATQRRCPHMVGICRTQACLEMREAPSEMFFFRAQPDGTWRAEPPPAL